MYIYMYAYVYIYIYISKPSSLFQLSLPETCNPPTPGRYLEAHISPFG